MAQQATASSRIASLILRILTFILLLISLIVLATNTIGSSDDDSKVRFTDFYAYRYMLATIVIGIAYTLLQLVLTIFNIVRSGDSMPFLDFFGDKFISYVLATGAAAGFGLTVDLKRLMDASEVDTLNFDDKAFASASLLLLAFVTTAILSIISAYTLPKRV
ncbi:unnamed protein product [Prunus brigantina]